MIGDRTFLDSLDAAFARRLVTEQERREVFEIASAFRQVRRFLEATGELKPEELDG